RSLCASQKHLGLYGAVLVSRSFPDRFHYAGLLFCFWPPAKAPFLYAALLPACFKAQSNFHHRLVPHAQENSSLCHPQWFPFRRYSWCLNLLRFLFPYLEQ